MTSPMTGVTPIPAPDGVRLWCASLDQPPPQAAALIATCSGPERDRAARMPVARRRCEFLVGRGLVRGLLGAQLGIPGDRVRLAVGTHGKPYVAAPGAPAFSVSHSGGLLVLALSCGPAVGVDVERVERELDVASIARRFLAPPARAELLAHPEPARARAFLRLWTRKEACAKATGTGFAMGFDTGPPPGSHAIVDMDPAPGYVGALALAAPDRRRPSSRPASEQKGSSWPSP